MQCPPTPGPGVNFMNPNGFVAAALMTSQTSRPIRSHSSASWLTNAMLTLRKTFSRSFASSAASGDDSSTTWSLMLRSSAAARFVACGVVAPTRRGTPFEALAGSPGLTRSGANARSKSTPAFSPLRSTTSAERTGRRPGERRGLEHDQLARADVAADRLGGRQDRGQVGVLRRGDRGRDAHEDRVRLGDRRIDRRPRPASRDPAPRRAARRRCRRSGRSGPWSSAMRSGDASTPSTSSPASEKAMASGRPT